MILKRFSVFYMLLFLGLAASIARGQASMQRGVRISNSNGNIVSIQTGTGTATYTLSLPLTVNPALTTASVLYGIGTGNLNWTDVTGVAAGSILTLQNSGGNLVPVWVAPSGAGDWLLVGNSITSGWDGTTGSFLGTINTQPLVLATTNTATAQPIEFFTNNTERMRLSAGGYLGIGQTNPSQLLEVRNGNFLLSNSGSADQLQFQGTSSGITTFQAGAQGTTNINYTLPTSAAAANNYVLVSTTGGVMSWADANTLVSGNYWSLTGNATASAWNGTAGNFLGTTTTQPLVIATTNTATAQPIEFYTNNVEAMRLSAAGELGIGVTPVAGRLLDVGGTAGTPNVRFTSLSAATPGSTGRLVLADGNGDLQALAFPGTAGQVLSSSTSGGLSWTTPTTGVTSVGLGLPVSVFNVTGSPVTSVGTLTGSFTTQTANTVFAGPVSGAAAVPTFRSLVPADLPSLNSLAWLITGNSGTTAWNGTTGNFLGTTDAQPLVVGTTYTTTAQPMEFFTNNTERMRLSATGNLGIGQTNPSQLLEVRNGNFLLSNSGSADQLQFQGTGSGLTTFQAGAQGATNINYTLPISAAAANNYVLVSTTGGVMSWADPNSIVTGNFWSLNGNAVASAWNGTTGSFLGTTSTQPLVIATTNTTTAQPMEFFTGNTERMRLSAAGNLGIGQTNPSQLLEVRNGNLLLSNSGTADQLQFQGTNTGVTTFSAGAQGVTNLNYTLPTAAPSANSLLYSSGGTTSNLSWTNTGISGQILTITGGVPSWQTASGWLTSGNSGQIDNTSNLLGTLDNKPIRFVAGATGTPNTRMLLDYSRGDLLLGANSGTAGFTSTGGGRFAMGNALTTTTLNSIPTVSSRTFN
ncbi:MAG: hypothetical protein Q8919_13950, partial [Bacteroidota bacterium]|nr:hypothetical protein [Bacteroidota bacterium]